MAELAVSTPGVLAAAVSAAAEAEAAPIPLRRTPVAVVPGETAGAAPMEWAAVVTVAVTAEE
jgi:hypothetical protein